MATFSENQVRQLYVVNDASTFTANKDKEGALYFNMVDSGNKPVRSDLITNIMYAKATSASAMQRKPKTYTITATDADMVAGQDYIVKINYRKFISQSDEDTYQEMGSAHCVNTGDDVEVVLLELAKNLYMNTKKQNLVHISVMVSTTEKEISALGSSDVVTAIVVREVAQPWTLGLVQEEAVDFTLTTSSIIKNADDYNWATIVETTASQAIVMGNGKKTADLEYFCLGERGDIYRGANWPNIIPTTYMVDPTKEYDYIDIHFAYVGANHAVQKSEKDITLVFPVNASGSTAELKHAVASTVLTAINTAAGSTLLVKPSDWTTPTE